MVPAAVISIGKSLPIESAPIIAALYPLIRLWEESTSIALRSRDARHALEAERCDTTCGKRREQCSAGPGLKKSDQYAPRSHQACFVQVWPTDLHDDVGFLVDRFSRIDDGRTARYVCGIRVVRCDACATLDQASNPRASTRATAAGTIATRRSDPRVSFNTPTVAIPNSLCGQSCARDCGP
jgi:hypothetical protein